MFLLNRIKVNHETVNRKCFGELYEDSQNGISIFFGNGELILCDDEKEEVWVVDNCSGRGNEFILIEEN